MAAVRGTGFTIRIEGLSELRRALRQVSPQWGPVLGKANQDAAQIVATEATRRAPRGPHQGGGRVAPISSTITALRKQNKGVVAMGGARSPHAPPTEFGGTLPRHASSKRTRVAKRPFLYPALQYREPQVIETYGKALEKIMRTVFNG